MKTLSYHFVFAAAVFLVFLFPPRVDYELKEGQVVRRDFAGFKFVAYATSEVNETHSILMHVDRATPTPDDLPRTLIIENHRRSTVFREVLAGEGILIVVVWGGLALAIRLKKPDRGKG